MEDKFLLVWLEAPMQSWGCDSKFGRRDTIDFPTRSGILGLFCCALGAGGPQEELLARWSKADMSVNAYSRVDGDGVVIKRPPPLEDFHMVGSAYDETDPWESLFIPKTCDGKKQVGTGTKITYRYYIQDMAYAVVIKASSVLIEEIANALQAPVWDIYLGRKSCAPTEFVFQGVYEQAIDANNAAENLATEKDRGLIYRVVEGAHEGEVVIVNDVPLRFGTSKRYSDRIVTIQEAG